MNVRVFAPAKINLTLEVGKPRADGMHPLQSVVMFADVGDWVEAAPADALALEMHGPFASALQGESDNLVLRAARLLDPQRGARLRLEKNLPVASGIGGGSSDAAAALKALNELWQLQRSPLELNDLAAALGSDVPVCVAGRTAWMSGTGGNFAPMQAPALDAVLVNPGLPLATPSVYRRFDAMGLGGNFRHAEARDWRDREEAGRAARALGNDLEPPAIDLIPEIGEVLVLLRNDKRVTYAGLSGSGATCFALTWDAVGANALASDLAAQHPEWWVRATRLGAT